MNSLNISINFIFFLQKMYLSAIFILRSRSKCPPPIFITLRHVVKYFQRRYISLFYNQYKKKVFQG